MGKKLRKIGAAEFKAKILAILDEVAETGETILVTKRGKPVAKLSPAEPAQKPTLKGTVHWCGDIESPVLPPWD